MTKSEEKGCRLCPRACGVNREKGQKGICGQTQVLKAARADLHMWEEPCISGSRGSGTIFFSGCNLHCVFCQNREIASGNTGIELSVERLADICLELQEKGANNINLVTGFHYVPQIIQALAKARSRGLVLPVLYNSSGYESPETLRMLAGYIDIYLPDFKYADNGLGLKYSHVPDYFERASAALEEMVRQVGEMRFCTEDALDRLVQEGKEKASIQEMSVTAYQKRSENGESLLMTRGVIVRHLLLPGMIEDSKKVIKYLLETYGEQIFISMMNQYTPLPHVKEFPELMQRVSEKQYEELVAYALELGIENGFVQEGDVASESFIPSFDGKGILK